MTSIIILIGLLALSIALNVYLWRRPARVVRANTPDHLLSGGEKPPHDWIATDRGEAAFPPATFDTALKYAANNKGASPL